MTRISKLLVYLILIFSHETLAHRDLLEKYKRSPGELFHGRYTRNVREAELFIPRRVHEDGTFHSFSLPSFYDRQNRGRRASGQNERAYLIIPLNGIDHHIELTPYHGFISPEMIVESRRVHANNRKSVNNAEIVLFLQAGYVLTNEGRYFIEPINAAKPELDGQHVHMAFKRETPDENGVVPIRRCGTRGNWEKAWAEELYKREKNLLENDELDGRGSKRANSAVSSATHSIHRYIEIGVVADRKFLDFHKDNDYEQYLLTVMNMVSDFYHERSVGNQIDVVVVRMIYLEMEKEELDLSISSEAEKTLDSFSKWALKMNPTDPNHPNHYDIAVLVTRYDICSNDEDGCSLMGLAYVGTACDPPKAACINEDSGLLLGIVVAHEVGHVMGCSHDDVDESGCPPQDKDESYYVMSPIVFIYTIRWSTCSRKFITNLLQSGLGECLNNDPRSPSEKFKYPNMLPGAMYDADFQCKLLNPIAKTCENKQNTNCEKLWCFNPDTKSCFTMGAPAADGTKCGEKKWCIHKKCVEMGTRPAAVNGGWSDWGAHSECSRTCGGGIKYSERECDKPTPANGGRYCIGERKRIVTCNTKPCDPKKPPFRAVQCAEYDTQKVLTDGLMHKWAPYVRDDLDACALYCIHEGGTFVKLSPTVKDGTPCKAGTNYMCVFGSCRKVGCDWILDSDAIEDQCGDCKGGGTKCSPVEGDFTETGHDYTKIVRVPKGARSLTVRELKPHENTLAVKSVKDDKYCLNGGHREERTGVYECAGTLLIYSNPEPSKEEIFAKGPFSEEIEVQYVFYQRENPGVHYKYFVPLTNSAYKAKYMWEFLEWSECNAKCGGGTSTSEASCIEQNGGKVTNDFCKGIPRPEARSKICNQEVCPAKWRVSQWSKCSGCGGKKGVKHRKVLCVRSGAKPGEDDVQTDLEFCGGKMPLEKMDCVSEQPCRPPCVKSRHSRRRRGPRDPINNEDLSEDQRRLLMDKLVDRNFELYVSDKILNRNTEFQKRNIHSSFRELFGNRIGGKRQVHKKCWFVGNGSTTLNMEDLSTLRPGSIVKDPVSKENILYIEAPYQEDLPSANLSDLAFQQGGDVVPGGIDTSDETVYKGDEAIERMKEVSENATILKQANDDTGFD